VTKQVYEARRHQLYRASEKLRELEKELDTQYKAEQKSCRHHSNKDMGVFGWECYDCGLFEPGGF
jgi:hypothetical protein